MNDVNLFRELVRSDMTVAERFVETVREVIAKIKSTFGGNTKGADNTVQEKYGVKVSELETAVSLWEDMLAETKANLESGEVNRAGEMNGVRKYNLRIFPDGKRFVDVQTDQHLFDGLTEKGKGKMATKIIKERFSGKVVGRDNKVFVNGRSATEYGHPSKKLDAPEQDAKMRASTELDNLIDAGTNFRTAPDGKDGHIHPQATGDFKYFDTIFEVGNEYYQGTINILPNERGDLLIDITQIKNITQDICSSYGKNPKSTFLRDNSEDIDSSTNSIPATPQNVNRKNSLKTEDLLSPEYGTSDASQMQNDTSSTASGPPSPRGEGSGLDEYFDDLHSRAEVIDDKRLADAEKIVKNSMNKDKSTLGEKVEKAKSYAIRKMVNSGHALRKIANEVGDKFLYPIYNKTRSSSNIASDMIGRKQTDVLGREVGN